MKRLSKLPIEKLDRKYTQYSICLRLRTIVFETWKLPLVDEMCLVEFPQVAKNTSGRIFCLKLSPYLRAFICGLESEQIIDKDVIDLHRHSKMSSRFESYRRRSSTRLAKNKFQDIQKCGKDIHLKTSQRDCAIPLMPRLKAQSSPANRDALQAAIGEAIHSVFLGDMDNQLFQLRERMRLCEDIHKHSLRAAECVGGSHQQQRDSPESKVLADLKWEAEEALREANEILTGYLDALEMARSSLGSQGSWHETNFVEMIELTTALSE